jgi:hypothetical protein
LGSQASVPNMIADGGTHDDRHDRGCSCAARDLGHSRGAFLRSIDGVCVSHGLVRMSYRGTLAIVALVLIPTRAQGVDVGTASSAADAGALPDARDPALLESLERERTNRLMTAHAFEARAQLERDLAAKQKKSEVKRRMLDEADRLASQADQERRLAGEITPPHN